MTVRFADAVIVGGGCYGTFYAGQLLRARAQGKAEFDRLLLVDRDPACRATRELGPDPGWQLVTAEWGDFFDRYLARRSPVESPAAPDVIVPSPLMPHLMYQWLERRARARWPARLTETRPVPEGPGTPYDQAAPDGTRYVSFADWTCPTHCVEPALCPVTRGPRTWEMGEALAALVRRLGRTRPVTGPVLFHCEHQVFGVGTFSVTEVLAGDARVAQAGATGEAVDVLVGTVSSCHGAVNLLHLGPG
ncbi:MAG TPA: hypothetical protein VNH46_01780 [Gemmatimonadales bacterium]|nr:hypothetical protein [Gemmatimonadales bacterium]